MPEVKIILEVDDKGTVKVKKFTDETKKAFDETKKGAEQAKGPLDSLRDGWMAVTAKVAIVTAAFYAAKRMIYDTAFQIASATNDIERQAAVLGISTDEFQKWQYAAKMSDVNAQELAIGLKLLSRNMEDASSGSGDAAKYFSAMGVSVKTTEGHLRPLNDVMGDIMDKFTSWEDGPRKIAIAMQLFGRSGETIIPLLNKGRTGFNELAEEARKFGVILSPDLIRKGSEAEDIFKKINIQIEASKLYLAPAALEFAKFFNDILEGFKRVKEWKESNPTIWDFLFPTGQIKAGYWLGQKSKELWEGLGQKIGIIKPPEYPPYEPGPYGSKGGKKEPPELTDLKKYFEEQKSYYESWAKQAEQIEKMAYGGMENKAFFDQLEEQKKLEENLYRVEADRAQVLADDMFPAMSQVNAMVQKGNEDYERQRQIFEETKRLIKDFGWEDYAAGADAASEATRELSQLGIKAMKDMADAVSIGDTFAKNFGSSWDFNVKRIISESKDMGDALKNTFEGMADAFASSVSKMMSNWVLFGSITGEYKSGQGVVGWLGSAVNSIIGMQHGGWINEPILGIGKSGQRYTFGERGSEMVVPESQTERGGNTYNYNIDARGAQRGVSAEIMRAIRASENRAVIRSVNQVADNKMRGGRFAKIFE